MRSRKPPTDAEGGGGSPPSASPVGGGSAHLLPPPLITGVPPARGGPLRPIGVPSEHSCVPTTPSAEPAPREASNRVIGNGRGGCRPLRPGVDLDMQASGTGSRGRGQDPIRSGAAPAPVEGGSVLAAHPRSGAERLPASQTAGVREGHAPSATRRTPGSRGGERNGVGSQGAARWPGMI